MPKPQQQAVDPAEDAYEGRRAPAVDSTMHARAGSAVVWTRSGPGYSAAIDGREYRVTKYPADSPMGAPFGAYAEGRFIGSGPTLENVKSRCSAHAGRLRMRSPSKLEG